MAFNGSGTFLRLYNWVNDAAANIKIRADRMDAEMNGMATGLSTCITKDGQTTIAANLPMATYRHTGVGAAVNRTDYARTAEVQDGSINWVDGGGTADAITASYSIPLTALVDGQLCYVRATAANTTTTPTFSPSGITARTIVKNGNAALAAGDIAGDGHELILRYRLSDTKWELLNPAVTGVPTITGNNSFSGNNTFTGKVLYPDDGELTIASGAITVTGVNHTVDTEGDAASDDLDTINGGADGQILILSTENSSRDVVVTQAGNIATGGAANITLGNVNDELMLKYDSAQSKWLVLAATAAQGAKADTALQNTTAGLIVNRGYAEYKTNTDISTAIPLDDTIPQVGEGTEILSVSITPKATSNRLRIRFQATWSASPGVTAGIAAAFVNGASDAVAATMAYNNASVESFPFLLEYEFLPGSVSSQTVTIRVGPSSGTMRLNGTTATRRLGGASAATLVVEEIVA